MHAEVETAMQGVKDLVAADGGDIAVVSYADGTAVLQLILEGAECRECVMPKQFLEQIALDMMQPELAGLSAVEIQDPREEG